LDFRNIGNFTAQSCLLLHVTVVDIEGHQQAGI